MLIVDSSLSLNPSFAIIDAGRIMSVAPVSTMNDTSCVRPLGPTKAARMMWCGPLRPVLKVNVLGPPDSRATLTPTWLSEDPRVQPSRTVRPMAAMVATPTTSLLMAASLADGLLPS
jgi:hypothetical protein